MRLPKIEYARPATLAEACSLLEQHEARVLAGGTDLIPALKQQICSERYLVDLKGIGGLEAIELRDAYLRIGALVRLYQLEQSLLVQEYFPALSRAVRLIAGPQHRVRGTVGGNICLDTRCWYFNQSAWWRSGRAKCWKTGGNICHRVHKSPTCVADFSGDLAPLLVALEAQVEVTSNSGSKVVPLKDFYTGDGAKPLRLRRGEVVTGVMVPIRRGNFGAAYYKYRLRESIDFPVVGVAARIELRDGVCSSAAVVAGAIAPAPLAVLAAEVALAGQGRTALPQAAEAAYEAARPTSEAGGSVLFKKKLVRNLALAALEAAWNQAEGTA